MVKFKSTRQGNDPLNPHYQLPKVEFRQVTPPKFIRDAMDIDDIDKTRPNKGPTQPMRDILKIDDIEGTRARMRHRSRDRSAGYNAIDYGDVTKVENKFTRCSNPLDPVYNIYDEDGKIISYGGIDGNKPGKMPEFSKAVSPERMHNLNTKDIEGAQTSTKGLGIFAHVTRREEQMKSNNLDISDVPDAQAGSLKKGITTKRITNPLDGDYLVPGWKELENSLDPFSKTRKERDAAEKKAKATASLLKKAG